MKISFRLTFLVEDDQATAIGATKRAINSHTVMANIKRHLITWIPLNLTVKILCAEAVKVLAITNLLNHTITISKREIHSSR